ncbi:hypothetical protein EW146_g2400 [Bondarzewia mesenterica]|uniref:Protein kinase domain-containing protein n=1 Tax=Bondarzewia mesenterica TaxID=1095465 RepID=A0A4V3XFS4_9AGAM|nr:hypothetical protein EW146_g2400 [Bondarzewia mesenterica]
MPSVKSRTQESPQPRPARRPVLRMDAQDGPWTVSVAENPHDPASYSLYVKTPTHNLTLSRTAREIVELHHKLRDSHPGATLPQLPIQTSIVQPAKRKSAFLNTLSRLASPASKSVNGRHLSRASATSNANAPSLVSTPVTSPRNEIADPFSGVVNSLLKSSASTNPTVTGLAAYLTTISNDQLLRQAPCVSSAPSKRVRSDLAAHMASPSTVDVHTIAKEQQNGDAVDGEEESQRVHEEIQEEGTGEMSAAPEETQEAQSAMEERPETPRSPKASVVSAAAPSEAPSTPASAVPNGIDEGDSTVPSTPIATESHTARIPRSQSAGPAKSARLSRIFSPSTSQLDGNTASQTEDDSSINTSSEQKRKRKKRSKSADPKRELKKSQRKVQVSDFEMMRVLGKGCAGKVLLVRYKSSSDLYALKAITKRHVLAHQELQHTLTEQAVLKRMAAEGTDPFVVKLWWSFHDKENLFLVMDFHPGGDLATQLARWGRLGRDRARFYAAEIVEGVEGLHAAGVIYRDLKPENILIAADGHIVLTDFGLSKEFPRRTMAITAPSTPNGLSNGFHSPQAATPYWMNEEKAQDLAGWPARPTDSTSTFCGTAEYLAPEVIQGLPYGYEVDWWSFGTMLYEMLTGITPFWADNHSDMYVRVLQDELQFPDDRAMDQDTKSLVRGLLQRNPALRLSEPRIKRHPYFSMIDWSHVYHKRYIPPYIPPIDPSNASDTQNFDDTFLDMEPVINDENDFVDTDQERDQTDTDRTDGEDSVTTPSQSRSSSVHPQEDETVDVFDGYSFKGRHSVILGDEEDVEEVEESGEEEDEDEVTPSLLAEVNGDEVSVQDEGSVASAQEQTPEPKTPEARPAVLPETPTEIATPPEQPRAVPAETPAEVITPTPRSSEDVPRTPQSPVKQLPPEPAPPEVPRKESRKAIAPTKPSAIRPSSGRAGRRREKSGIPALDRDLSDAPEEDEAGTEREEDEDDWDFIEADGEDRNGAKGTSLFARGVVDRYKLAVFRKGSTPNRSVSGISQTSDLNGSDYSKSPSPADKQRRGRTPGLTFRRNPKPFLLAKSPPSTRSSTSNVTAKTLTHSTSANLSASTASSLLPPTHSRNTFAMSMSPSLKSKESAVSIGSPNSSSDASMTNDDGAAGEPDVTDTVKAHPGPGADDQDKQKNKKLKKYKEGAEKVLSLFASPR